MAGIQQLNTHNFMILGRQTKTLGTNIPGNMLVLFKMTNCQNCATFEPIFVELANSDRRVSYGIANISNNTEIVKMSRETSTPIAAVPFLILYINGRPHAKFNGTKSVSNLQTFITKALQNIGSAPQPPPGAQNQQFMGQSTNMYGGYNVAKTSYGMVPGHAGPTHPQQQQRENYWKPEIGNAPSMNGVIRGNMLGPQVEDEDDNKLLIPDTVVPYNTPWEVEYRRME